MFPSLVLGPVRHYKVILSLNRAIKGAVHLILALSHVMPWMISRD